MQACFCYDILTGYNSPNVHDYLFIVTDCCETCELKSNKATTCGMPAAVSISFKLKVSLDFRLFTKNILVVLS